MDVQCTRKCNAWLWVPKCPNPTGLYKGDPCRGGLFSALPAQQSNLERGAGQAQECDARTRTVPVCGAPGLSCWSCWFPPYPRRESPRIWQLIPTRRPILFFSIFLCKSARLWLTIETCEWHKTGATSHRRTGIISERIEPVFTSQQRLFSHGK